MLTNAPSLQIVWSVELAYGSPYLLSLGISKSLLAIVWIAGPLSGTLVQPYVGIKSDNHHSRFGKRRPFIVGGAAATIVSLIALAWAREWIGSLLSIFGVARDSRGTTITAIVFAVIMVYVLDFSINVIQAAIRAFIVDNAPTHQQDVANAWATRLTGVGNIIGYLLGYMDLPTYFWFLGNTEFKVLCIIASLSLALTVVISCLRISERDSRLKLGQETKKGGVFAFFKSLYSSVRQLSQQIRCVCQVQFFAWIGWFPFLFYITTYVGEIYVDPIFRANPNMTPEEIDQAWERGTQMGTFALEIFAITSFATSVIIPWFIQKSIPTPQRAFRAPMVPPSANPEIYLPSTPPVTTNVNFHTNVAEATTPEWSRNLLRKKASRFYARVPSFKIPGLTLRRAWMLSHILFALLTWLTFFARSITTAIIIVSLIGIPWAMTNWAPFAIIAAEISQRQTTRSSINRVSPSGDDEDTTAQEEQLSVGADQAGVVLGIHNVAIAAPQVIATLVSSAIFKALQKPRGTVGDDSVAWVLRFGGLAALIAAYLVKYVK